MVSEDDAQISTREEDSRANRVVLLKENGYIVPYTPPKKTIEPAGVGRVAIFNHH